MYPVHYIQRISQRICIKSTVQVSLVQLSEFARCIIPTTVYVSGLRHIYEYNVRVVVQM